MREQIALLARASDNRQGRGGRGAATADKDKEEAEVNEALRHRRARVALLDPLAVLMPSSRRSSAPTAASSRVRVEGQGSGDSGRLMRARAPARPRPKQVQRCASQACRTTTTPHRASASSSGRRRGSAFIYRLRRSECAVRACGTGVAEPVFSEDEEGEDQFRRGRRPKADSEPVAEAAEVVEAAECPPSGIVQLHAFSSAREEATQTRAAGTSAWR